MKVFVATLALLLVATAIFVLGNAPTTPVSDTYEGWSFQTEIQNASDTERNPWKRDMDN